MHASELSRNLKSMSVHVGSRWELKVRSDAKRLFFQLGGKKDDKKHTDYMVGTVKVTDNNPF